MAAYPAPRASQNTRMARHPDTPSSALSASAAANNDAVISPAPVSMTGRSEYRSSTRGKAKAAAIDPSPNAASVKATSPSPSPSVLFTMATFKKVGTIHTFQHDFLEGMRRNGYSTDFAERCFNQIRGFGTYGFPESHAASFALLVYISCYIKRHYPDAFACALLNSQPMGFYAPPRSCAIFANTAAKCVLSISITAIGIARWSASKKSGNRFSVRTRDYTKKRRAKAARSGTLCDWVSAR